MDHNFHFSTFSQAEEPFYIRFREMRDRAFAPVCGFLTRIGIKPDHLSYFNLGLAGFFVFTLLKYPYLAVAAIVLGVVVDMLDGCLARHQKISSERGALLDITVDQTFFFTVVLTLIYAKSIDGFWGAMYSLNYLLMVMLVMVMRAKNLHVFPIVRSKYYFYILWMVFVFSGLNYLDIFLVFFSVYMVLTNLFLFHNYRCSLP